MLQLMADRSYAEFTFERFEYRFDLRQLHVARPKDAGISGGKIGAQQVVPVALFLLKVVAEVIDPVMRSFQLSCIKRHPRTIEATNIRMMNLLLVIYPSIGR